MSKASVLERVANALTGGRGPAPSDLLNRKAAAEAAVQAAETEYRKAALAAERGDAGATQAKVAATEALALAKGRVRDIDSALLELRAEEAEATRKNAERIHTEAVKAAERQLEARVAHAEGFTKAITEAANHLDALIERSNDARNVFAKRTGKTLPIGGLTEETRLQEAIRMEISRACGTDHGATLGGKYAAGHIFDPDNIVWLGEKIGPLVDRIRLGNAFVLGKIRARA